MAFHKILLTCLCFLPIAAAADESSKAAEYHKYWRDRYFKPSKLVEGGAYVDYKANNSTCSEAIGFGMLIALASADHNETQAKQDLTALNLFRKAFPSNIDSRLMAWKIEENNPEPVDTTCATDGDLDNAYALIMAGRKWQNKDFFKEGTDLVKAIGESLVRKDFSVRRGDWDHNQHSTRLSDIMPTHFRLFAQVSDQDLWSKVEDKQYQIIKSTMGEHGVFPDFVIQKDNQWIPAPPNFLESENDGAMYYNSCRVPWRISWAALQDKSKQAIEIMAAFNEGIGKPTNPNFKAGYRIDGQPLNEWTDGAFTAPHMCSLLVNDRKADFNRAFEAQLQEKEGYYQDSIRLLCLYLCEQHARQ